VLPRGNDLMIDCVTYDLRTGRTHTGRITVRDGCIPARCLSVRLYGFTEFARLLRAAGFRAIEGFDRNGEPLPREGRRLIVVVEKQNTDARRGSRRSRSKETQHGWRRNVPPIARKSR
jgi:hypothetical protein